MLADIELLQRFFALENERCWKEYGAYLADDVVWILNENGKQVVINGKKEYLEKIEQAYEDISTRFEVKSITKYEKKNEIITLLENEDGDMSLDIFEIKYGKIVREWEYIL